MSSNSIFSSGESEKRWVLAMEKYFPQHHILNVDFNTPFCVFNTQSESKPEAYAPQQLGLGPLHHLRPHLYTMHNHKLAAITKLLPPEKLQNFHLVVDALLPLEPVVRACYDQYLDLDIQTLAWIFAIDGLYLLHFLKNYPEMKHLAGDVLMLENQIPLVLLNKILDVLELDRSLFENLQTFLEDQSPLELNTTEAAEMGDTNNDAHLLHRMHHLIVNNNVSPFSTFSLGMSRILFNDAAQSLQFLADRGLPGAGAAGEILSFVNKIPWGKISGMFKKNEQTPSSSADEIDIPSVSQMAEIAGIKFILTNGGIRDIKFDDQEKKFHLPSIKLTATSEIVLRNLVAYEAASAQPGELAEYVDLMCGIIDSAKDVDILRKEGIIVQSDELDDDEIARIFNGISKSEKKKKTDDRTNVEEAVDNVNTRYSSLVRVKVGKLVEKYAYASFKLLSVLITIAVLLLLTLQAFCSVFGCGRWFSQIATQSDALMVSYQ